MITVEYRYSRIPRAFYSLMFFVMSLGSVNATNITSISLVLFLVPLMVLPSFAQSGPAEEVIDAAPPHPSNNQHQEKEVHKNTGNRLPFSDTRAEVYTLKEEDNSQTAKVVGFLILSTDDDEESNQFQCVLTYSLQRSDGSSATMIIVYFVTILPGIDGTNIEKICHGRDVKEQSSVTIEIFKDGSLELEIEGDLGINEVPEKKKKPDFEGEKDEDLKRTPLYDGPIYIPQR